MIKNNKPKPETPELIKCPECGSIELERKSGWIVDAYDKQNKLGEWINFDFDWLDDMPDYVRIYDCWGCGHQWDNKGETK